MKEEKIDFKKIEKKWQDKWEKKKVFEVKEDSKKKKYYVLEQFPYPSGSGLHVGHAFVYTIGDIFSRFKIMQGFNVLHPMGYDSLGLPAENAANETGVNPKKYTEKAIEYFSKQQKAMGLSYDWDRMFATHKPEYYKWDQWIFLKMFEKGLVYQKESAVNYCRKCDTVLANEQVHSGKCWRHEDTPVEIKHLKQWYFKITNYAEELNDFSKLNQWPDLIKKLQKNWIGKSHGSEILFEIEDKNKVILVDAVDAFVIEGKGINKDMYKVLEEFSNKKIILTNANDEQFKKFGLDKMPYEVFTLKHNPDKRNPEYYKKMLKHFNFNANDVIYFEHDADAVKSAESVGIKTFYYNKDKRDITSLKKFIEDSLRQKWPIFTTRPDTIYGVTFMVVSSQHTRLMELVTEKQKKSVEEFLKKIRSVSEKEMEEMEKEGVFTGSYAINPINNEKVPVYAGNFVLADYGCGMVMAVPGHDQRDFEFAKKYNIPIKEVIMPVFGEKHEKEEFRRTISAVVHRKKDNKYLLLKWKEFNWLSPIVGGIEKNEEIAKAAEREVLEETGYRTKFIKKLGGEIESHFYADNKKVWRHRLDQPVLMELLDEKPEKVSEDEKNRHEAVWLDADNILKEITHSENSLGLLRYLGEGAYTENGILINSDKFNGMDNETAKEEITNFLEKKKLGKRTINFRLKDWLISRQRYWGTPIPIIYCEKCGVIPVSEKDLPVKLPEKVKFGKGNPLETAKDWIKVKCPKCKGNGKRETDTMDTFVNSSWYHLRFCDPKNNIKIFKPEKANYWNPIDIYIGGKEHACMHDIYIRFYHKFLRDLGLLKSNEPAEKLFVQGIVHGQDGNKMSKSLGNTVDPMEIINKYGADSLRLFLISNASPESDFNWSDKGVLNINKLINKIIGYFENVKLRKSNKRIESKINKEIKEITEDIENLKYNLAVIKLRQLFEVIEKEKEISKKDAEDFLKMLCVFCPHIAEELWEKIGNKSFISLAEWPKADEKKINERFEKEDEAIEKLKQDINNIKRIMENKGEKKEKVYVYVIPNELGLYKGIEGIFVYTVNDKGKYDPQNKAGKAKPGKPAIYLE